ncbi:hypothetical protein dqs_0630 [Azoarcus olearius]|uniref:hypothetical protein n=1 Tax=Azoarcus sp. (strain BH72) TaxID=418699 RepID=UPI0008060D05|nr:hypothetical protein [Azoarcus olearius]ANQ83706.1 hypothetical protein dqs_0630 [Azoarcus olearius]
MSIAVANELDLLFAAPECVSVGGERVDVRGVRLSELPRFLRLYDARPALPEGGELPPQAEAALAEWQAGLVVMLSNLCCRSVDWLSGRTDAELGELFGAMRRANRILFDPAPARHGPRNGRGQSWATAAAWLVECGHSLEAVGNYTLAQIEQLTAAHGRLAADRSLDALSIARAAQADRKGYSQALAALKRARTQLGQ